MHSYTIQNSEKKKKAFCDFWNLGFKFEDFGRIKRRV